MKPYLTGKDYLVSQQAFTITECVACGLVITNPRPTITELGKYYKAEAYTSHNDNSGGLINYVYRLVRNYTLTQKEKLVRTINGQPGKLLDYGCGTGSFLEKCSNKGWAVYGVEPDAAAAEVAQSKSNSVVYESVESIHALAELDVITLWHVLEHVTELKPTLTQLVEKLRKGGHLIIAVPNVAAEDATHFGQFWAALDVPRHLYHFKPTVLTELIRTFGLKLIQTVPMRFDAYYIALMSTKQRDGETKYLESVVQGFKSNWQASKTGNYSSVTYVFRKE